MECNQVVPLLSTSPDDLTLVVGRRAAPMFDETDELLHMDQEDDEHRSATVWHSSIDGMNGKNHHSQVTISTL